MPVVRWKFDDPVTLASYTFDINPVEGGSPAYQKQITFENTSAPDGKVIVFEGRDQPKKLEWSGVILDEDQFNAFVTWFEKRYQVQVTDDLGREFSIYIESFVPRRERARSHPWKHSYTVTATVVDWT